MVAYTRQNEADIADGLVIEAADLNAEFDAILAFCQAPTIGAGAAGTDIALTFDGESADGVITWMEDEDYFKFSDDILLNTTEKLMFNDTGTYIYSNADGDLDIVSDGTAVDSINLESAGGITLDAGTIAELTAKSTEIAECSKIAGILSGGLLVPLKIPKDAKTIQIKKFIEKACGIVESFKPIIKIPICGNCGFKGEKLVDKCPTCKSSYIL